MDLIQQVPRSTNELYSNSCECSCDHKRKCKKDECSHNELSLLCYCCVVPEFVGDINHKENECVQ